jgi:hypothetical protein
MNSNIVDLGPLLFENRSPVQAICRIPKQGIEMSAVNFNSPRVENHDAPFVDDILLSQQSTADQYPKAEQYRSMYAYTSLVHGWQRTQNLNQ